MTQLSEFDRKCHDHEHDCEERKNTQNRKGYEKHDMSPYRVPTTASALSRISKRDRYYLGPVLYDELKVDLCSPASAGSSVGVLSKEGGLKWIFLFLRSWGIRELRGYIAVGGGLDLEWGIG